MAPPWKGFDIYIMNHGWLFTFVALLFLNSGFVHCQHVLEIRNIVDIQDEFGKSIPRSRVSSCSLILVDWLENDKATGTLGENRGWLLPLDRNTCNVTLRSIFVTLAAKKLFRKNFLLINETTVLVKQSNLYQAARRNRMVSPLRKMLGRKPQISGERDTNTTIPFLLRTYQRFQCLQFLEKPTQQPATWLKNTSSSIVLQTEAWLHLALLDFIFGLERREDEYCFQPSNLHSPIFIVPLRIMGRTAYSELMVNTLSEYFFSRNAVFRLLLDSVLEQMKSNWSQVTSEFYSSLGFLEDGLKSNQATSVVQTVERNTAILSRFMHAYKSCTIPESPQFGGKSLVEE
jgi:hypothetical protein